MILYPVSGGDPFLHPNFEEVIAYLRLRKIGPLIGITGIDVTIGHVRMLQRLSISNLQLSLDGSKADTELLRGSGTYECILRSLELLHAYNIKCSVAVCVHKSNAEHILEECKKLIESYPIASIKIQFWKPIDSEILDASKVRLHAILEQASALNAVYHQDRNPPFVVQGYNFDQAKKRFEPVHLRYPKIIVQFDAQFVLGRMVLSSAQ